MSSIKSTRPRMNLAGQLFGQLLVIEEAAPYQSPSTGKKRRQWLCQCTCGARIVVQSSNLRGGYSTSCGCFRNEAFIKRLYKHGHKSKGATSQEYTCWQNMKARCGLTGSNDVVHFNCYESRGITVCERWLRFENFLADMGPIPGPGYSIERTNNDGNYEPSNCGWMLMRDQGRNRRTSHMITFNGETHNIRDWARMMGIEYATLFQRIHAGWPIEKALTMPVHAKR